MDTYTLLGVAYILVSTRDSELARRGVARLSVAGRCAAWCGPARQGKARGVDTTLVLRGDSISPVVFGGARYGAARRGAVRPGAALQGEGSTQRKVLWMGASPIVANGWAWRGIAGLGWAWRCEARQGLAREVIQRGKWAFTSFDTGVVYGSAMHGKARQGPARRGTARPGKERQGQY